MGAVGQIHAVQANVRYPDSVRRAADGAEADVNLTGILHKSGAQTFQSVHVGVWRSGGVGLPQCQNGERKIS
jgi:uncharacterized protein YbjT (DUF2867 family)